MEGSIENATCAMSESSNINGYLFLHWLQYFKRNIPKGKPVLLMLDGHFSHLNHLCLEYAKENSIDLFLLPTHCSHFLQPFQHVSYAAPTLLPYCL